MKTLLYILTIVGIVFFLFFKRNELIPLLEINSVHLIILFVVGLVPVFVNAYRFKHNIKIFNFKLPFKEWFGLTIANSMYSYLLPFMSGLAIRAIYLKKKYMFDYPRQVSFLTGAYLINFLAASGIASGIGLYFLSGGEQAFSVLFYLVLLIFFVLLLLTFFLFRVDPERIPPKSKAFVFLRNAARGLHEFKNQPGRVLNLMLLHMLFIITLNIRMYVAFLILQLEVDFVSLLFIQSVLVFSMVLSITPGNIGVNEGIVGIFASFLGLTVDQALLGAVLDRIIGMIIIFVFGIFYSKILMNEIDLTKTSEINE